MDLHRYFHTQRKPLSGYQADHDSKRLCRSTTTFVVCTRITGRAAVVLDFRVCLALVEKEPGVTVQRILNMQHNRAVTCIAPDAVIGRVLQDYEFEQSGVLVVSGDGKMVEGIISERDIVCALRRTGPEVLGKPVRELMAAKVVTCTPDDRAAGVMALMVSLHVRHVPVVTDGKLVGMVSIHDLLQLRLEEVQSEAEAMRSYISGTG
jgi:CBS domain-containing protein